MKKKNLLSLLVVFTFIFISFNVFAEPGDLKINNQVIYRQNETKNNTTNSEFVLPDLFLEKKTNQETLLKEKTKKKLNSIETALFREKTPNEEALYTKVIPLLFSNEEGFSYIEENDNNLKQSSLKNVGVITIIFLGAVLFLVVGIFLGKKFSHVFK